MQDTMLSDWYYFYFQDTDSDSGEYGDAFDDMPWEYLEWRGVTWSTIMRRPALVEKMLPGR